MAENQPRSILSPMQMGTGTKLPRQQSIAERKSLFSEWCAVTAYHGVLDFYLAKGIVAKLAWLFIVLCGGFLAVDQSLELILDYALEDKWITTMSTEFAKDGSLPWPNILLCKTSPLELYKNDVERKNISDVNELAYYLFDNSIGVYMYNEILADVRMNESDLTERSNQIQEKFNGTSVAREDLYRLRCEDTVIDCGDGLGDIGGDISCNCSKFSAKSSMPSCFSLNASDMRRDKGYYSKGIGYGTGAFVLLNPRVDEIYPSVLPFEWYPSGGLLLGLYFQDEEEALMSPIALWPGSQIVVSMSLVKKRTVIRTRHTLSQFLKTDDLPCVTKGQYKYFDNNITSKKLCQADCDIQFCMELVNCQIKSYSPFTKHVGPECNKNQTDNCRNKRRDILPSGFNVTKCESDCKDPCETENVLTKMTSVPFPSPNKLESFTKYLNRPPAYSADGQQPQLFNFSTTQVGQMILLNLFYDSKEYQVVEKINRVSIDDLISDIGGVLGVWTGISMITILQALVYLFYGVRFFIKHAIDRFRNRNNVQILIR